jgi:hypothetical protein
MRSALVSFLRCALVVLAGTTAGCSALLDWKGYTGGDAGDGEASAPVVDSGDDASEGGTAPKCGVGNCGGCCNADGQCTGGLSTTTCGTGGASCIDCSSTGLACSGGRCVARPTVDAGPQPACDPGNCTICIPVYQSGCCKTDMTCGFMTLVPPTGCL